MLLLKTNMGAGHGGKSGRFESLREAAEEFAFVLWQLGIEGSTLLLSRHAGPGPHPPCRESRSHRSIAARWTPEQARRDEGAM